MLFKMSFAINRMSDESKAKISSLVAGTVQNNKTLDIRQERDDSGQIASRGFKKANCEKLKYTKEIVGIFWKVLSEKYFGKLWKILWKTLKNTLEYSEILKEDMKDSEQMAWSMICLGRIIKSAHSSEKWHKVQLYDLWPGLFLHGFSFTANHHHHQHHNHSKAQRWMASVFPDILLELVCFAAGFCWFIFYLRSIAFEYFFYSERMHC